MENSISVHVSPARQPIRTSHGFPSFRNCFVVNFEFYHTELYSRYTTTINRINVIQFEILCDCTNEDHNNTLHNMYYFVPSYILNEILPDIEECARQMMANNSEEREILHMNVLLHVFDEEREYINQNNEGQAQQVVDLLEKLQSDYLPSDSTTGCSICLEEFCTNSDLISTKCSHIFHEKCMVSWIQKCIDRSLIYSCPLCRCQITGT